MPNQSEQLVDREHEGYRDESTGQAVKSRQRREPDPLRYLFKKASHFGVNNGKLTGKCKARSQGCLASRAEPTHLKGCLVFIKEAHLQNLWVANVRLTAGACYDGGRRTEVGARGKWVSREWSVVSGWRSFPQRRQGAKGNGEEWFNAETERRREVGCRAELAWDRQAWTAWAICRVRRDIASRRAGGAKKMETP